MKKLRLPKLPEHFKWKQEGPGNKQIILMCTAVTKWAATHGFGGKRYQGEHLGIVHPLGTVWNAEMWGAEGEESRWVRLGMFTYKQEAIDVAYAHFMMGNYDGVQK